MVMTVPPRVFLERIPHGWSLSPGGSPCRQQLELLADQRWITLPTTGRAVSRQRLDQYTLTNDKMSSLDGRLDLEFTPFIERVAKTNLLVITSEVHQMFGRYRGTVITDEGEVIKMDGLIGWAEEHHARW